MKFKQEDSEQLCSFISVNGRTLQPKGLCLLLTDVRALICRMSCHSLKSIYNFKLQTCSLSPCMVEQLRNQFLVKSACSYSLWTCIYNTHQGVMWIIIILIGVHRYIYRMQPFQNPQRSCKQLTIYCATFLHGDVGRGLAADVIKHGRAMVMERLCVSGRILG